MCIIVEKFGVRALILCFPRFQDFHSMLYRTAPPALLLYSTIQCRLRRLSLIFVTGQYSSKVVFTSIEHPAVEQAVWRDEMEFFHRLRPSASPRAAYCRYLYRKEYRALSIKPNRFWKEVTITHTPSPSTTIPHPKPKPRRIKLPSSNRDHTPPFRPTNIPHRPGPIRHLLTFPLPLRRKP